MRALAEQSGEAALAITAIVSRVQSETRGAVADVRTHVSRVAGEGRNVTSVADELCRSTTLVGQEVVGVAAVRQENAAAAQEVAAASEQTSAAVGAVGIGVADDSLGPWSTSSRRPSWWP